MLKARFHGFRLKIFENKKMLFCLHPVLALNSNIKSWALLWDSCYMRSLVNNEIWGRGRTEGEDRKLPSHTWAFKLWLCKYPPTFPCRVKIAKGRATSLGRTHVQHKYLENSITKLSSISKHIPSPNYDYTIVHKYLIVYIGR